MEALRVPGLVRARGQRAFALSDSGEGSVILLITLSLALRLKGLDVGLDALNALVVGHAVSYGYQQRVDGRSDGDDHHSVLEQQKVMEGFLDEIWIKT